MTKRAAAASVRPGAALQSVRGALLAALLQAGLAGSALAAAGELTVVSVAPLQEAIGALVASYEQETGRHVSLSYAAPSRLAASLKNADHPDLVLLADDGVAALAASGHGVAGAALPLARVGLGVAVRQGAATPDISTPAALRQALLDARSVAYLDPDEYAGGRQAAEVIAGLGLGDALKSRTRLGTGSSAVAAVASGDVELGVYPVDRILSTPGVRLAGTLPAQLQRWTHYQAALLDDAANVSEARELLRYLGGTAARKEFTARGFQPLP